MQNVKSTLTASLLLATALFAGNALADGHSRSGGATISTDSGKTYDVDHQASTDGKGNYSKSTTVNGKEVRSVEGGQGKRTVTRGTGASRTVVRGRT